MISSIGFLVDVVLVSLGAVFLLIFFEKIGLITLMQANASRIFGRFASLPNCNFCLLFWLCFLIAVPLWITLSLYYFALPFLSAPLAKAIYENSRANRF